MKAKLAMMKEQAADMANKASVAASHAASRAGEVAMDVAHKAVDVTADVANTNIDRAVAAKENALALKDNALALKARVQEDGIKKVSTDMAHDAANSVKDGVVNAANKAVSVSKSVYETAKDMNLQKAKVLMMNEAFSRITNSKSAAKPPVLLATAELDITLQQCRDEVAKIVEQCKQSGTKYTDTGFPTTTEALYADPNVVSDEFGAPKAWKRISEIKTEPKVFTTTPQSLNIDQGDVGTCFLLGSLGVLAIQRGLIEELFVAYDLEVGVYGLRFFINDYWRAVIIDDFLPTNEYGVILYGASKDRDEFWVALIEKAYAKVHMCYQHIDGGVERYAMCDLTGGVGDRYDLAAKRSGINMSGLWKGVIREGKVGLSKPFQLFISFLGGRIVGGGYIDAAVFDIDGETDQHQHFKFDLTRKASLDEDSVPMSDRVFTGKYNHEKFALVGDWKDSEGHGGAFELTMFEKKQKKEIKGIDSLNMFSSLWDVITERSKGKVLMTCAIEDPNEVETEKKLDIGLLKNHAYGVTGVFEVHGNKLLRIMNPHGKGGRWNGRWSDTSPEMNVVYKALLGVKPEDNGIFFMCYDDFAKHFTALDLCQLFDEDWHVSTIRGMWRTSTCGAEDHWPKNPQAQVTLHDKAKVIIKLSQPTPKIYSGIDSYPIGIGFKVVYCNTPVERVTDEYTSVVLASVEPQYERSVSIEITLTPFDLPYFIIPYTSDPALICPFTLSVYATADFTLTDLTHNLDPRIASGQWMGTSVEVGGDPSTKKEISMDLEFEMGGCVATHNEDEQGEYIVKGGFIPSSDPDTPDDFQLAFQKEYAEATHELYMFNGHYTKKTDTIEGKYTTTDLEGNPTGTPWSVTLTHSKEESFMEELGLMVDIIADNLNQYRAGLKKWFDNIFPALFSGEDDGDAPEEAGEAGGDVAAVKGRSEVARVKGRAEMARVKGRAEVARVKGRVEMARVKGRAVIARVKGRSEMARVKGRSEVARVKGRSEVARMKGRSELLRVKGRNGEVRLPPGMVATEVPGNKQAAKKEAPTEKQTAAKATANNPPPVEKRENQVEVVAPSGGMCTGSKICTIQ